MSQRIRRQWVALAAVALVTAACVSGGGDGDSTQPSQPAESGEGTEVSGGTLRVAVFEPVGLLKPHDYTGNLVVLSLIYDSLVVYDEGGVLSPGLAESWQISDDGLTYTFELRDGVSFHDGEAFDAEAAALNFDRWLAQESHSWLGAWHVIDSVEAVDDMTLEVGLSEPYPSLLHELSFTRPPRFLSPSAIDEAGEFIAPIGTGPWKLEAEGDDGGVTLVRNDDYWNGVPKLESVEFKVIPDSQIRVAAIQSGEIDVTGGEYLAALAPEEMEVLEDSDQVQLIVEPGSSNLLLAFNTESGPLGETEVRRAINLAIDRESIASSLFRGFAEPASAVYPESVPNAETANDEAIPFDPTEAAAALEGAGWTGEPVRSKDGQALSFDLVMDQAQFPQARALSEALKAQLAEVGVEANIRALDSAGYTQAIVVDQDYDMAFFITFGTPFDPAMSLTTLFQSSASTDDGKVFTAPELDPMISEALAAADDAARQQAFDQIWSFFEEEWATAPLVEQSRAWAINDRVSEYQLGITEYDLPLRLWTVTD